MKQTVQLDKIQEQMKPGKITLEGFIGKDKRKLVEILIEDDNTVKTYNLTHEIIGKKMLEFRELGLKGLEEFIEVGDHFEVKVATVRGKLPCPFGDPGIYPKINTVVKNLKTGREITYTDLQIHMISEHGFYEGKNHVFRLDPVDLIEILEIEHL